MRIPLPAAVLLTLIGIGIAISGRPSSAQSAPAAASSPTMESVAIYVTPLSKKGVPADLKPGDLTITEDKVPAKIEKINCGKPEPLLLGLLLDVSASRRRDPLLLSHYEALHAFVNQALTGDDRTYLGDFSDTLFQLGEVTNNRAAISAAFGQLRQDLPRSSTAMYDAIKFTVKGEPERSAHRVLVVTGDWNDNSSHIGLEEAVEVAQRYSTAVYAIVDATDDPTYTKREYKQGQSAGKTAAEETGGRYYDVHGEKEFNAALQAIQVATGGSCRVEYSVPKAAATNKGIKLRVDVHAKDTSISYPRVRFNAAP
jgi:VWFA-related protein